MSGRNFVIIVTSVSIIVVLTVAITLAIAGKNSRNDECTKLNGHWLERYQLCISDSAIIRMPS